MVVSAEVVSVVFCDNGFELCFSVDAVVPATFALSRVHGFWVFFLVVLGNLPPLPV